MQNATNVLCGAAPTAGSRVVPFTSCRRPASFGRKQHQNASSSIRTHNASPRSILVRLAHERADVPTHATEPRSSCTSRRGAILALVAGALALQPISALADEEVKLPKEYRQLVKRLSEVLTESIEAEASGASEAEVRRKADPAKDTVREFVRKWRDNPRVSTDITHAELKEALAELGEFYLVYGQRTKLTPPVRESVLRHLSSAKDALPAEPEKGSSGLLDLFK